MSGIREHFKLDDGRYVITIVEGDQYSLIEDKDNQSSYDVCDKDNYYISFVCKKHFDKIFFTPDSNKRYDITVKKVK